MPRRITRPYRYMFSREYSRVLGPSFKTARQYFCKTCATRWVVIAYVARIDELRGNQALRFRAGEHTVHHDLRKAEIVQTGALDSFTLSQIAAMCPTRNETVYVSRLRDGSEVKVAKEKLIPILEEKVDHLRKNVDALVILCSGKMTLSNSDHVTFPSELLHRKVESTRASKLGVIVPEDSQSQSAERIGNLFPLTQFELLNSLPILNLSIT